MNRIFATRIILSAFGFAAMLAAGTASAEYRLTAFGDAKAYTALIAMDVNKAQSAFRNSKLAVLDFAEANNLCVMKILSKELADAVSACESSLEKLSSEVYISTTSEKSAKASIYSNLAVATALAGDFGSANRYLELSLSYNSDDENALTNYDLIATSLLAQN